MERNPYPTEPVPLNVAARCLRVPAGWLRDEIEGLEVEGRWQAVARSSLRENLFGLQRSLTTQVLAADHGGTPHDRVVDWLDKSAEKVSHSKQVLADMRTVQHLDFPTLSVALQEIRKLAMTT